MHAKNIALIFALAFLLAGCAQTRYVGYLEKDNPIGSQMQGKLPLLSKEECLFGSGVSIIKAEDPLVCNGLEEGQDYSITGKVSSYLSATSGMSSLAGAIVSSEFGKNVVVRISVPVVALEAPKKLEYESSVLDSVLWERNASQQVQMACGKESVESETEVFFGNGKYGSVSIELPAADEFSLNATLDKATFGYFDIGEKGSASRIWWLVLKIIWQDPSADGLGAIVRTGGNNYACYRLRDEGNASYYSCETYGKLEYADLERISIGMYVREEAVCSGAADIRH